MKEQMLTTSEAAKILRVHVKTMQRWDRSGELKAERSPSGRRLYRDSVVKALIGLGGSDKSRKIIAYCRVSSQAQKPDLKNQREAIEQFCLASANKQINHRVCWRLLLWPMRTKNQNSSGWRKLRLSTKYCWTVLECLQTKEMKK